MSVTPKSEPRSPPGVEIPSGTVLGSYRVLSELGRGGMGVVYRAEDLKRGGTVALKTLLWGDPSAMLRFKQEFRGIADITHPNLATLFELVAEEERLFFTMELVEGVNFAEWVKADPSRLRPTLAQLAQGLSALHAAGRIHRDLKPSNVRVTRDGRVVILDFGLAATLGRDGAHQSTILAAKGTPAYMAPEQAQGKPVNASCDWYGVGVMLHEALAGRLPFEGSGVDVLVAKQMGTPPPVSDIAPDVPEDLDALCTDLLQQDPERRPDGPEVLRRLQAHAPAIRPEAPAEAAPAIVGREQHLRALREAFEAQREGYPVIVLVHGYSGMGKTTLVQSFQEELTRGRETVVLQGKCYERESVPYKALDGPIDALARHLGRLPRAEAEALLPREVHSIARVFPVLRKVEAIAQAPPPRIEIPDAQEVRRRAFAGLREVFARISDRVPLLLCVDDLQWGDADSADLLASLLRPPEAPAFLFVGCYRREDADTSPFLEALRQPGRGLPEAREILVDPLSEDEAVALAGSLLTDAGGPAERAAALARESRGSPFFLHELAAYGASGGDSGGITLDDVLRRRFDALTEEARSLLEVVAVAGGPVPRAAAAFAAQLKEGAPAKMMAALRSARLVRVASSETDEELDTYHDRVRETVLAGLGQARRRDLRRRLGHTLVIDFQVDPEALGLHFEGAGDAARAGAHYARAADDAYRALAFDHAAELYRKVLELLSPTGEKRRDLLRRLADALADDGRGPEAAPAYLEAAEGAVGVGSLELRALAAMQFLRSGHLDEWRTTIEPVQRELGISLSKSSFRAVLRVLGGFLWFRLRGFKYRERDPQTIAKVDNLRLEVCYSLGLAFTQINLLQGLQYHIRAVRLSLKAGHPVHVALAIARHFPYHNALYKKDSHRLRSLAQRLVAGVDVPIAHAMLDLGIGTTAFVKGEFAAARPPLQEAGRRYREECAGYWWERNIAEFWWLMSLDLLGRFRELDSAAYPHLRDAEDCGNRFMETDLRCRIIPVVDLMQDAPERAREGVDRAIAEWPEKTWSLQRYRWLDARMSIALYHGDSASGRELATLEYPGFRKCFVDRVRKARNVIVFGYERIVLALAAESRTLDRSTITRLGRDLSRAGEPYAEGWGLLVRAGAANLAGDAETTLRHLEAAEAKFTEADMTAYRAVTRRRRGELIGGDEGRALIAESNAWLEGQGIRNPVAWARMYAPGFEDQP